MSDDDDDIDDDDDEDDIVISRDKTYGAGFDEERTLYITGIHRFSRT